MEADVIRPDGTGSSLYYFVILSIFSTDSDSVYAHVLQIVNTGGQNNMQVKENIAANVKLLQLTDAVRRVAVFHRCDRDRTPAIWCAVDSVNDTVKHCKSLLNGGIYSIYDRAHGYPPKSG